MINKLKLLFERIRSPKQAHKLLDYIKKKNKNKKTIPLKGHIDHSFLAKLTTDWGNIHADQHVPIHKIQWSQKHVIYKAVKSKLDSSKESKPILRHNPKTDKYHIIDGHHRIFAKKLRGDTHVVAHVIHNRPFWKRIKDDLTGK